MDAITIYGNEITPICVDDLFRLRTRAMEQGWNSLRWRMPPDKFDSVAVMCDAMGRYFMATNTTGRQCELMGFPIKVDVHSRGITLERVSTHCGYCGHKIGKGTHCTGCGAPYPSDETCAYCGSDIPTGTIKCTGCGHD